MLGITCKREHQQETLKHLVSKADKSSSISIIIIMHIVSSPSHFGATSLVVLVAGLVCLVGVWAQQQQDNCKIECYPNTKAINGKGHSKSENCRWILRTDGKPARLCDHIKCKKVCPSNPVAAVAAGSQQEQQQEAASSENMRIEQQTEPDSPVEPVGIMRRLHGSKIAKVPVAGVAGGRLSAPAAAANSQPVQGGRRMAPTLPPSVQYDENDTPPPISRFLDISPEE